MYRKIINHIELIETWNNEEEFLLDALFLSCSKLFQIIYDDINNSRFIAIAPLLRQIQESLVGILGVYENVYSMEEFIKKGIDPPIIMKRVKGKGDNTNEDGYNSFNGLLMSMKKMLNPYTHANFDGLMMLFSDRFKSNESNRYNRTLFKTVIKSIETVYIILAKINYKLDLDLPTYDLDMEIKSHHSIKYIINNYPDSIRDFINNSSNIKKYYDNLYVKMKEMKENSKLIFK